MQEPDPLELFRQRMLAAVQAYERKLNADLQTYRSQRAWRLMLAARKAYTLVSRLHRSKPSSYLDSSDSEVRPGWRGWPRLLRRSIGHFISRSLRLETAELDFPALSSFLPEELFYPVGEVARGTDRKSENARERRFDIVVLPVIDYHYRFQRPQQIAVEFARRGHRVFYISPSSVTEPGREYDRIRIRDNFWEVRLRMHPQDIYQGVLGNSDLEDMRRSLAALYRDCGIASSCVLVQFPYWRRCALALRELAGAKIVYDRMDNWRHWNAAPGIGAFALAEEQELMRESDLITVSSRELEAGVDGAARPPLLLKNAADFRFFARAADGDTLQRIPRPIVGYYGAIADWFDLELIHAAARSRPDYSFVLIGHNNRKDIERLAGLRNVFLLGEKHYRELPSHLSEFDVCLIPFKVSELTRAVDPVKIYEYFSQGKPVVSMRLPELERIGDMMYLADSPTEFIDRIDDALSESDNSLRARRVEYASRNTWADRVEELVQAIEARYPLISILIVTHNSREYIRPCLDAIIRNTTYPNFEVVIVDNDSSDGTPAVLQRYAERDTRIRFDVLRENLGFAGGNNEAARQSRGEYLLLLNADTIVTAGWMHRLLRLFERVAETGVAVPVSNFSGNETKINFDYSDLASMESFASERAASHCGISFEVDVAPLFCALITRQLWFDLGGLDEGFRVGMFEDDDLALRVHQAGRKIMAAEDCFVHHFGNGSFKKLPSQESLRIFDENRRRFEQKWNRKWVEHRLRPGIRRVSEDRIFAPESFV